MIRNLKTLGIAMAAVFAFSAMSAASASAQTLGQITGPGDEFTLQGEEIEAKGANAFTAFGLTPVECPETVYTGHKTNTTPHQNVDDGDTSVTITPNYLGCKAGEGSRTVDVGDCDYKFYDFTTAGGEDTYAFTVDLECEESAGVLITGGACTATVPPQTELTGLHATNKGSGVITIGGTVHSITASACGGLLHTEEAELHQSVEVFSEAGEIEISD